MKRKMIYLLAACAFAMGVQAFTDAEKTAVRREMVQAEAAFRTATALNGKALTLLPVRGDEQAFAEELLIGALVKAGKTVVVSDDNQKDARFKAILKEIRWDERMTTLGAIDPATVDLLGKLKSTQILMEAKLDFDRSKRHPAATLSLLAYAIETKQYVWSADLVPEAKPAGVLPSVFVRPAKVPLAVAVVSKGASAQVAEGLAVALRAAILKENLGVLDGTRAPEVTVMLDTATSTFDKTGSWFVLEGATKIDVKMAGDAARRLGTTEISARGARALGQPEAAKTLVAALDKEVSPWVKNVLTGAAVEVEAVEFVLERGETVEGAEDLAAAEAVRKALAGMPGVRGVVLTKQDNAKGVFVYRAVYEKAKYPGGFMNAAYVAHKNVFKPFEDR